MNNISILISLTIIGLIFWRRTRAMIRPIKGAGLRILLPMVFILPSITMFLNPMSHITLLEILCAIVIGVGFALPLIITTNYEVREDGHIYAKKSIGFVFAFIGCYGLRMVLRHYIPGLDHMTLSTLFMAVILTYVVLWRIASFIKFRKVYKELNVGQTLVY